MRKIHPTLLVLCATLLWAGVARAAHNPTLVCQQSKLRAQGELKDCLARQRVRKLLGLGDHPAECRNRFTAELKRIDEVAAREGTSCRYIDNGDGTVSDLNTGLMWEKKTYKGGVHDVAKMYKWRSGALFLVFLRQFNGVAAFDSTGYLGVSPATGCFANHCDWLLPSIVELKGIFDPSAPGCSTGVAACINPIFGPTQARSYWSDTSPNGWDAWAMFFGKSGNVFLADGTALAFVRAVRGGL